ncbi:hypothetical protein FB451DRAFT_1035848 [Mycena latifolia]|nr:hypothetical protein FB451DRAFT_1035848 [Mycena latifolia]
MAQELEADAAAEASKSRPQKRKAKGKGGRARAGTEEEEEGGGDGEGSNTESEGEGTNPPKKRARKAAPAKAKAAPAKKGGVRKGKGKRGGGGDAEVPSWAVVAKEALTQGEGCELWAAIMEMWWEREVANGFQGPARGHTDGRPEQIANWTARARKGGAKPPIKSAEEFGKQWWKWYVAMNPRWRLESNTGRLDKYEDREEWAALAYTGPNGMLNALICLRWWRDKLEDGNQEAYQEALEEVYWVLGTMA